MSLDHKQRMLEGKAYRSDVPELKNLRMKTLKKVHRYNALPPDREDELEALMKDILGKTGDRLTVMQPVHFDYGIYTSVGENFYANYNLTVLDVCPITIGDNVMFAPNVSLYTAGHPLHPAPRTAGWEYGAPITIGNNVWIGGSVSVLPGVTIGDNVVIGAGSVVNKDIPGGTLAAGNPCKVIRPITEDDKKYYFRRMEFDIDWQAE